jgi:IPT/TIG domain
MRIRFIVGLLVIVAIGCGFAGCDDEKSSSAAPSAIQPTVVSIQPLSGPVGSLVTIRGSGFADQNNTVKFGNGYIRGVRSTDGTTMQFTVPEGLDLCPPTSTGPCQGAFPAVTVGNYEVTVIADGTKSASFTFTVTK